MIAFQSRASTAVGVAIAVTTIPAMFASSGMDFILGSARFVGSRTVEITTRDSDRRAPPRPYPTFPASRRGGNSETILRLERLPESLLILGGGYIGCEFASMFAIFGTRVTVLQGGPQLLAREDPDVAAEVARVLTDQGVEVRLGARATAVRRDDVRHVVVTLDDGVDVRGEELLVATGRTPVTADHVWRPATWPAAHSSPTPPGTTSGLRHQQVRDALITHPTMGEGLNLLFDTLGTD